MKLIATPPFSQSPRYTRVIIDTPAEMVFDCPNGVAFDKFIDTVLVIIQLAKNKYVLAAHPEKITALILKIYPEFGNRYCEMISKRVLAAATVHYHTLKPILPTDINLDTLYRVAAMDKHATVLVPRGIQNDYLRL